MNRWEQLRRLNAVTGYQPDDLAGIKELAEDVLHVSRTVITGWNSSKASSVFPPPIRILKGTPVFSISEYILAWYDWVPKRSHKKIGHLDSEMAAKLEELINKLAEDEAA